MADQAPDDHNRPGMTPHDPPDAAFCSPCGRWIPGCTCIRQKA